MKRIVEFLKKQRTIILIVMGMLVIFGMAMMITGSITLAKDNAAYDYYHQTNRQAQGWLFCFVPACLAPLSIIVYFGRKLLPILSKVALILLSIAVILPYFYIIPHQYFESMIFLPTLFFFIAFLGMSYLIISKKMAEVQGGEARAN